MKLKYIIVYIFLGVFPLHYACCNESDLALGIAAGKKGDFLTARGYFQSYLKDHPNSPRALRGMGNIYLFVNHDVQTAIEYYQKAWEAGDVQSLGQMAFLYETDTEKYKNDLEAIKSDLRKHCSENHLVALSLLIIAGKSNDSVLFKQAYDAINVKNIEKPENVKAIIYFLKKFGYDDDLSAFVRKLRETHGDKFDEVLAQDTDAQ